MIIPTIIIYLVFIIFMTTIFQQDLQQRGEKSLMGIKTNLDLVVRDAVYQQDLMTHDNKLMLSLKKLYTNNGKYEYGDDTFLDSMESNLRSVVYSHSYLDSIYLYLDGYNYFISSSETGTVSLSDYSDVDWYKNYLSEKKSTQQWVQKRDVSRNSYAPPEEMLTVYHRMNSTNGVIVININKEKLVDIINSIVPNSDESFYILNSDNSPLLANQNESKSVDKFFQSELLRDHRQIDNLSGKWYSIGNNGYLANVEEYSEYNIYLVSLISQNALISQIMNYILDFVLILIGNCLIVFLLAYSTTRRIFRQINYMIEIFSKAENGDMPSSSRPRLDDEFDMIMNNIILMFIKTTYMKSQLMERKQQLAVAELKSLQMQINPHFLLNTLQTLDFEALKLLSGPSSIHNIIHDLSDILKYALGNPLHKERISEELDYLKRYVNIQHYRFGENFIVYYEIEDELLDYHVPRLILQPLLENSITHGVQMLERKGYIKLKIFHRKKFVHFRIIDNGVGMEPKEITALYNQINDPQSRNIGLTNVNRRLILEYGEASGLHILSKKGMGTSISFQTPYTELKNQFHEDAGKDKENNEHIYERIETDTLTKKESEK